MRGGEYTLTTVWDHVTTSGQLLLLVASEQGLVYALEYLMCVSKLTVLPYTVSCDLQH